MKSQNLAPIAVLIFISILTKIVILLAPVFIPHTGLDPYDLQYFFNSAQQVAHGIYPVGFPYPFLALVPMLVTYYVSMGSQGMFSALFQFLMCICDAVIIACIYMIGLKFLTRQQSFIAGLLYALSLPVAYFSLTKFDSLPAALLMMAIYFTIYGKSNKGEWTSIFGACTKIYPIIAFPFLSLYNRREVSLKIYVAIMISALIIFGVFRNEIVSSLIRSQTYVNTPVYVISSFTWIPIIYISVLSYIILLCVLLLILGYSICREKNDVRGLLIAIGESIFALVMCMQYHSPQYFMWYAPIFCLLVVDSVAATFAFCAVTAMVYLEFPLLYNVIYQNDKFLVSWAPWFFVVEWAVIIVMVYLVIVPKIQTNTKI